jgi:hypothetical protein
VGQDLKNSITALSSLSDSALTRDGDHDPSRDALDRVTQP